MTNTPYLDHRDIRPRGQSIDTRTVPAYAARLDAFLKDAAQVARSNEILVIKFRLDIDPPLIMKMTDDVRIGYIALFPYGREDEAAAIFRLHPGSAYNYGGPAPEISSIQGLLLGLSLAGYELYTHSSSSFNPDASLPPEIYDPYCPDSESLQCIPLSEIPALIKKPLPPQFQAIHKFIEERKENLLKQNAANEKLNRSISSAHKKEIDDIERSHEELGIWPRSSRRKNPDRNIEVNYGDDAEGYGTGESP